MEIEKMINCYSTKLHNVINCAFKSTARNYYRIHICSVNQITLATESQEKLKKIIFQINF